MGSDIWLHISRRFFIRACLRKIMGGATFVSDFTIVEGDKAFLSIGKEVAMSLFKFWV